MHCNKLTRHQYPNGPKTGENYKNHTGKYGTIRTFIEEWLMFPGVFFDIIEFFIYRNGELHIKRR